MTSKRGSRVRISLSPRNAISKADAAPQGAAFLQVAGALGELALQMPRLLADRGLWPLLPLLIAHGQPELPEGVARRNLAAPLLQRILFQLLYVAVYAGELVRDRNALRTLRDALLAVDAVVGLAQGRDSPVVADQVCLAKLHVIFLILALLTSAAGDILLIGAKKFRSGVSVTAYPGEKEEARNRADDAALLSARMYSKHKAPYFYGTVVFEAEARKMVCRSGRARWEEGHGKV